ncbi:hypothetical protein GCM10012275_56560 [Longimycelium tulufanense]|uniref:HNH nuclease domain-containing protein n=1 Tax=Longimycelium tulufanense TaxID=907463 RepID=A0A8J3CI15_9PSEU|nr:HNH endonuclease [Longimycelium tulufanense]GGM78602.1 hypothetical protein GCM10012275_56560 [Longimycelium tulufanense]
MNFTVLEGLLTRTVPGPGGCLLWTGARNTKGYPYVRHAGRMVGAHRLAYVLTRGDLDPADAVHHRCGVPSCINPHHLQASTHVHNAIDMHARRALEQRIADLERALRIHAPNHPLLHHTEISEEEFREPDVIDPTD